MPSKPTGRPRGRPPGKWAPEKRSMVAQAKELGPDAIRVLSEIMKNEASPESARISAAQAILDRGFGKAVQQVNHAMLPEEALSDDELDAGIAALERLVAGGSGSLEAMEGGEGQAGRLQ